MSRIFYLGVNVTVAWSQGTKCLAGVNRVCPKCAPYVMNSGHHPLVVEFSHILDSWRAVRRPAYAVSAGGTAAYCRVLRQ